MPKNTISTKGIVIREAPIGEADKLLTLLTPTLGRITVRCRGVRTLKSRRFAASQLYAYSDLLLSEQDGRYTLEEAEVLETFFALRSSLEAVACANYFADLLYAVTVEEEGEEEILRLFLNSLAMLTRNGDCLTIKAVFEFRLTSLLGLMPDLSGCSLCGSAVPASGWLDAAGGVLICSSCAFAEYAPDGEERVLLPFSGDTLSLMRYVASCESRRIFSFSADRAVIEEFSRIAERFLLYHIGRDFDTLDFLHTLL